MATVDLTKTFEKIGQRFVIGLRQRMEKQVGIDGGAYYPPKPSTMERRNKAKRTGDVMTGARGGKTRAFAVGYKRLYVTGELSRNAFNYIASPNSLIVFCPATLHKDGGTYKDIIKGNSRNWEPNTKVHKNGIGHLPMVFPKTREQVNLMKDETNFTGEELKKALTAFVKGKVPEKVEITVG